MLTPDNARQLDEIMAADDVSNHPLFRQALAEVKRLRAAIQEVSELGGLTLIAPSLGPDGDRAHQQGAAKAFNQAAEIARAALHS